MDYPPSFSSMPPAPKFSKKARMIAFVRKILLALIIAIAVTAIGYFVYEYFFMKPASDAGYLGSRERVANLIHENSQPVSEATRMQIMNLIQQNAATPTVSKDGKILNSTPVSQREQMLQLMNAGK